MRHSEENVGGSRETGALVTTDTPLRLSPCHTAVTLGSSLLFLGPQEERKLRGVWSAVGNQCLSGEESRRKVRLTLNFWVVLSWGLLTCAQGLPRLCAQESLLAVLGRPIGVPGIENGLSADKTSTTRAVLLD